MSENLLPCPFCGGEAELEQTGQYELTIRCVGPQPSGLRGCGPKYVQKITKHRFTLEWLAERMAEVWNRRSPSSRDPETSRVEFLEERLQAIIDWCDIAMRNADEFDSHGVRNLDGPVFDAARDALSSPAKQAEEQTR
jgi:hypothetical protein